MSGQREGVSVRSAAEAIAEQVGKQVAAEVDEMLERGRARVVELATLLGNVHMALGARVDETIPEAAARVVRERDEAVRRAETYKAAAIERACVARLTAAARRAVAAWNGGEGLTTEDFDALEAALVELGAAAEDVEADRG